MKTFTIYYRRVTLPVLILLIAQLANENPVAAQIPVCNGTTMYAIFNDSLVNNGGTNVSYIYPVSFATGAVGATSMGTTVGTPNYTFVSPAKIGGSFYYGSASLALDFPNRRFYVNTQMPVNTGGQKGFYALNTNSAATPKLIATTTNVITTNVPTLLATGLNEYHFVKMAVNPSGSTIYALGVTRDSTVTTAATANPLIRMDACGTTNCANANLMLLGYLPPTPGLLNNWQVFNGDMAFTSGGDLYISTVGYQNIGGSGRYSDARLFKIAAANIPTVPGSGSLTTKFVADYNTLDSSAVDGIAFDALGAMYITTKKFIGIQNAAGTTFKNQLYKSTTMGSAVLMPAFTSPVAGFAIADLASCSFPLTLLPQNDLTLYGKYKAGNTNLSWSVNDNTNVEYYEVQRGDDGGNFSTIARVEPQVNGAATITYTYNDPQSGYGPPKYYRVREVMNTGIRMYSAVITILFDNRISLLRKPLPNPFVDNVKVDVQLKSAGTIIARLTDQSGRIVYQRSYSGTEGENNLNIDGVLHLAPGIYILELAVGQEIIREKLVKR